MKDLITPFEDIKAELKLIQSDLEITTSEDVNELEQYGNMIAVHMARSGKIYADSKYYRDHKMNEEIMQKIKEITKLSASSANKFIDTLCAEENYLVAWSERVNRACVHRVDWCRTLISKAKEEMRLSGYQGT